MVQVTIRPYDQRDAADLADVFFRSVRQVALSDYTAAQVGAWAPECPTGEQMHEAASDGRLTLVAASEHDRVVAYIDLERMGTLTICSAHPRQRVMALRRGCMKPLRQRRASRESGACSPRRVS